MKRIAIAGLAAGIMLWALPALAQATHFDVERATQAYLATVDGPAREQSDAYFEGGYWILLWSFVVTAAVNLIILYSGWAARLSAWAAARSGGRGWLHVILWVLPYAVITAAMALPWTVYTGFAREHQYRLSTQSFDAWFGDYALQATISALAFTAVLVALFAIIRRSPTRWWAYGAGVTVAFLAFLILIAPVFVEPLFNTYTPLPKGPLREAILDMARTHDVPADDVFVVDASRQTNRISANVSGLGGTTRIALNDNLLDQGTSAQIRAVMGHELGHYVLGHIWRLLLGFGLIILGAFLVVHLLMPHILARYGARWRIVRSDDPAMVAIGSIIVAGYFLAMTPVTNSIIRINEQEADVFGLDAARAPDGFAQIAMKLSTYRKLDPTPLEEVLFFDHPSGRTRIETAMRWKAEHLGEPGVE